MVGLGRIPCFWPYVMLCEQGVTAERGHRATWETPALWRCHRSRPGRGRTVFKGKEENSEQSVTQEDSAQTVNADVRQSCRPVEKEQGARTHQKLYGSSKHSRGEEDEKPPTAASCFSQAKREMTPCWHCHPLLQPLTVIFLLACYATLTIHSWLYIWFSFSFAHN